MAKKTVTLIICDGWGEAEPSTGNAISQANTPRLDALLSKWPHTLVAASGEPVGLPKGQMGNSEVGHLTIGAGRVLMQPLARQIADSKSGAYKENKVLVTAMNAVKERGSRLHLIGLISDGDVHAHTGSAHGLLRLAKEMSIDDVLVHAITDGRDTAPRSGSGYISDFVDQMKNIGIGRIASISGRYYAMDRDERWYRIEPVYSTLTDSIEPAVEDATSYLKSMYELEVGDEFMPPVRVVANANEPTSIEDNDVVIFFNFRPDRARQLSHALIDSNFTGFERKKILSNLHFVTMTEYDESLPVTGVAYPREYVTDGLAEIISRLNKKQYHVAETEKYAHVTYFFNGGQEVTFTGEDRNLIPSPKVATYDLQPEMSARLVADDACSAITSGKYDLVVLNFANADMVGHTGKLDATIQAIEVLDGCIGDVIEATLGVGGVALMTADHGNAEIEVDPKNGGVVTAHTTSPVPVLLCGYGDVKLRSGGSLADIAPTILEIMDLEKPGLMTGESLID